MSEIIAIVRVLCMVRQHPVICLGAHRFTLPGALQTYSSPPYVFCQDQTFSSTRSLLSYCGNVIDDNSVLELYNATPSLHKQMSHICITCLIHVKYMSGDFWCIIHLIHGPVIHV